MEKGAAMKRNTPRTDSAHAKSFVFTIDDEHMPKIGEVAATLASRGVKVDSVMAATGIISGSSTHQASEWHEIPGILSVEEQPQFQLPPPGSPVQ